MEKLVDAANMPAIRFKAGRLHAALDALSRRPDHVVLCTLLVEPFFLARVSRCTFSIELAGDIAPFVEKARGQDPVFYIGHRFDCQLLLRSGPHGVDQIVIPLG